MSVTVMFEAGMASLGPAVAAIGVFDGVHVGHQALLGAAVRDALRRGVRAVAITFDRDPDQVTDPENAAPQLLTLDDKVQFIGEQGIEAVLVVPFTPEIAQLSPGAFLNDVLAQAIEPVSIHVGHDFRFGSFASGDVGSLEAWGDAHGVDIAGHRLLEADDAPVTSTRIRDLVDAGEVAAARRLLGRPTRVSGLVVHGRGEGAKLGAPTANLVPAPFAALPADGVYAGYAEVADGIFAAAISVGTPPMFPQAKDYLEAHLIDFDGDLYDQPMTLQFLARLRSQRRYDSLDELVAAIRKDVRETADVVRREEASALVEEGTLPDGTPVVDDPEALLAAERAVAGEDPFDTAWEVGAETAWVAVRTWRRTALSDRLVGEHDLLAAWSALRDEGIPTGWDPWPPGADSNFYWAAVMAPKPISLLVPEEYAEQAMEILGSTE